MTNIMETTITISGELRGKIWMPAIECTKEFKQKFSRDNRPFSYRIDNLRDALLHITNDGDFQSCALDYAVLTVTKENPGHTTRTRSVVLQGRDGNADCYN
jgi:hypothetical protein